ANGQTIESLDIAKKKYFLKTGYEHWSKDPAVKQKKVETNIKTYGCNHPAQNLDYFEKTQKKRYKTYNYILPSGKEINVQGYEGYIINWLLENGISEEDIITQNNLMPKFQYVDKNNKKHTYYPDIMIKSLKLILEVKSYYTYNY